MKRRSFLRRTGLVLAALGVSDGVWNSQFDRHRQVLAAPTARKLALLIGINQYRTAPLNGCLTDVALQQELLTHRFGFHPNDILTLTDQQATRTAIEAAFLSHLVKQVRSGDVVVIHFSGLGRQVEQLGTDAPQPSLVTIGSEKPETGKPEEAGNGTDDLLLETLLLLLRSLPTDKITTVLDTSYGYAVPPGQPISLGQPLQGALRVRTHPIRGTLHSHPTALVWQDHLLEQTHLDRAQLRVLRRSGQMPGVLLSAASPEQLAIETRWSGFSAGLFTYALTQQLWQTTPATTLRINLNQVQERMEQVSMQQHANLSGQKSQEQPLLPYQTTPTGQTGADGVVVAVDNGGKTVRLWLGGLSPVLLEQLSANSLLVVKSDPAASPPPNPMALDETALDKPPPNPPPLRLQLLSREGLVAKAKWFESDSIASPVQVGQLVQEWVRTLPRSIELNIGLDTGLERIERVDAVSAFSAVPRVSVAIVGEQAADCVFGKTASPPQIAALPNSGTSDVLGNGTVGGREVLSYGLFLPGQDALPNTIGDGGEAVKAAVRRLVPRLHTRLATKLLNLTVNETSSRLPVKIALETLDPELRVLQQRSTLAGGLRSPISSPVSSPISLPAPSLPGVSAIGVLSLAVGSRIQYRLENHSSQVLYVLVLGLDSSGSLITLIPPGTSPPGNPIESSLPPTGAESPGSGAIVDRRLETLAPNETRTFPQSSTAFQWVLGSPIGTAETFLICSCAPFTQTLEALKPTLREVTTAALYPLPNPLEVAQAVLQDLHLASNVPYAATDTFALDVNTWAGFRFAYQVV